MKEPTRRQLLETGSRAIGRDLEDNRVEKLLRPWKAKVAALETELAQAHLRIIELEEEPHDEAR